MDAVFRERERERERQREREREAELLGIVQSAPTVARQRHKVDWGAGSFLAVFIAETERQRASEAARERYYARYGGRGRGAAAAARRGRAV